MNSPIADQFQRQKALDPATSFIVQAPAGSGKTELLIQRFLKLLSGVRRPEQILAMTFTRKAAGEMKSRVMEALDRAVSEEIPSLEHERITFRLAQKVLERNQEFGWRLLDNPARLKIMTMDSFCAALTCQLPTLSGQGASLSIEEQAQELYREIAHALLEKTEENSADGEAVRTILKHVDANKNSFVDRVIQLLEKRDQWMTYFFENFQLETRFQKDQEAVLTGLVESILQETANSIPKEKIDPLIKFAAYSGDNLSDDDPGSCLRNLTTLPEPKSSRLDQWRTLATLLLVKDGSGYKWRKQVTVKNGFPSGAKEERQIKKDFSEFLSNLNHENAFKQNLSKALDLPDPQFSEQEWKVLSSTLLLLPKIETTLRRIFQQRGKTDFSELALSALKGLGSADDPSDLLLKLDARIEHILVDEYQDTSYKQKLLLEKLTAGWSVGDGRTLFIVGDPMQSIYRFRDAEVGLFLQTRDEGFENVPLQSLVLETNFRSQKKIVDWVNACFKTLFPKHDNQDLGAIQYSGSIAIHPEMDVEGAVLHPCADDKGIDEAGQITQTILDIKIENPSASIAILVRARSHLKEIVQRFKESEIPFRSEAIDSLTSRPHIQDLQALLKALMIPLDRISWLSILRAPWCGLSLKDIHSLCLNSGQRPVWDLLNDRSHTEKLGPDGQARVERFASVLEKVQKAAVSTRMGDLIEACWVALGGPACVNAEDLADVEMFFAKVREVLRDEDARTLHHFDRAIEKLYANPTVEDEHAVQIMTMHKAKGLEFDYVLLPGLGARKGAEKPRLIHWMAHGADLLLAPSKETGGERSKVFDFLKSLDKEKEEFETLRLLYVSATRARNQLHLFGHVPAGGDEPYPVKSSLLEKLWPYVGNDWGKIHADLKIKTSPSETAAQKLDQSIRRLPANFVLPEDAEDRDSDSPVKESMNEEAPDFQWAGNQARALGNVLHRVFCDMAEQGLDSWPMERVQNLEPQIISALLSEGLSPYQAKATLKQAMTALNHILEDERGRWVLTDHKDHRSEYPLTGWDGEEFFNRVIDRTFVDESDVRWIVDYKTGRHEGAKLEKFFKEESDRYREQLSVYENLLRMEGETRQIKKALYYPMHQRLVEIE